MSTMAPTVSQQKLRNHPRWSSTRHCLGPSASSERSAMHTIHTCTAVPTKLPIIASATFSRNACFHRYSLCLCTTGKASTFSRLTTHFHVCTTANTIPYPHTCLVSVSIRSFASTVSPHIVSFESKHVWLSMHVCDAPGKRCRTSIAAIVAGAPTTAAHPTPAKTKAASTTVAFLLAFRPLGGAARAARARAVATGRTANSHANAVFAAQFRSSTCAKHPHTKQEHAHAPIVRHFRSSRSSMSPMRLAAVGKFARRCVVKTSTNRIGDGRRDVDGRRAFDAGACASFGHEAASRRRILRGDVSRRVASGGRSAAGRIRRAQEQFHRHPVLAAARRCVAPASHACVRRMALLLGIAAQAAGVRPRQQQGGASAAR
mmetsp:Transcript_3156/g.19468  ORF Transcript_3156/g.19468 Transcript_3156/m.19468 type:complete len:374 (+) Transcript_3156:1867-2988(+)